MKKIIFICPYFGKFLNYFNLFLKSCEYNEDINWLIFTDNKEKYKYPKNVKVIYISFEKFVQIFKNKFEFEICIDSPYKLCDYRPTYGYVLQEYIKEYDFWGHCDLDCVFGNIRKFIPDEVLEKYDKIFTFGHMTLYKNKEEVNERFKKELYNVSYKNIFLSEKNYAFDESTNSLSMNTIYINYKFPIYKKIVSANISCLYYDFRINRYDENLNFKCEKKSNQVFKWSNGKIYSIRNNNNRIVKEEFAYIHLQRRNMNVNIDEVENINSFLIIPNEFIKNDITNIKKIKEKIKRKNFTYCKKYVKTRYNNLKMKVNRISRRSKFY